MDKADIADPPRASADEPFFQSIPSMGSKAFSVYRRKTGYASTANGEQPAIGIKAMAPGSRLFGS